jgi:glutamyl-tRNA reductase
MKTITEDLTFYVIGLSYKKADVGIRSTFSLNKTHREALLAEAREMQIPGITVISTCNRTEIIGFSNNPFTLISLLCKYSQGTVDEFARVSYVYKSEEAVKHFIKIATGLDSQIIGDYEIVGQLKGAFNEAKKAGTVNAFLERLFNVALQASKEIKNNTSLSSGTTSVSYAAIQYIKSNFPDYKEKKILVFGMGDIGKSTVKSCLEYLENNHISVVNRTESKAIQIAETLDVNFIPYLDLNRYSREADILIVATGAPFSTITKDHLDPHKRQLIIDISIPSNVDTEIKTWVNKDVIDVDDLSEKTGRTFEERKSQIPLAETIVEKYKDEFYEWLHFRKHVPAIHLLKESLEKLKGDVIQSQLKKTPNSDQKELDKITSLILKKVVGKFALYLKENHSEANQAIKMIEQVFK